jgi:diaminopimelate epimerase
VSELTAVLRPRTLRLIKAHALGNDFLLAQAGDVPADPAALPALAQRACDRHRGPGADGLMLLRETAEGADTELFNADGGRAEVSGNGVRCAAAWLARARSLNAGARLVIGTGAGPKRLELVQTTDRRLTFRADMGAPSDLGQATFALDGLGVAAVVLRVGNPQCVVLGPATSERLHSIAAKLAVHPAFPEGTNVELAEVEAPDRVRILIWERGVGPTEASGTGACAAAVAAAFAGGASRSIDVTSPGGTQHVAWTPATILLTGWAEIVAEIEWWA